MNILTACNSQRLKASQVESPRSRKTVTPLAGSFQHGFQPVARQTRRCLPDKTARQTRRHWRFAIRGKKAINIKHIRSRAGVRAGDISFVVFGDVFLSVCVVVCVAGQWPLNYAWFNSGAADSQLRLCQNI